MEISLANDIVINASREIGGRQELSLHDDLSSVGIDSAAQIALLIERIVEAGAKAGYELNHIRLAGITNNHKLFQLRDMVAGEISAPKTCGFGHTVGAGQATCAFGHPASS
jgi:hypothetical protein